MSVPGTPSERDPGALAALRCKLRSTYWERLDRTQVKIIIPLGRGWIPTTPHTSNNSKLSQRLKRDLSVQRGQVLGKVNSPRPKNQGDGAFNFFFPSLLSLFSRISKLTSPEKNIIYPAICSHVYFRETTELLPGQRKTGTASGSPCCFLRNCVRWHLLRTFLQNLRWLRMNWSGETLP